MDWIHVAQCRAFVSTVMNLRVLLLAEELSSFEGILY